MQYDSISENEGRDSNDLIFKGLEAKITPKALIGRQLCSRMVLRIFWVKLFSNYQFGGGPMGEFLSVCNTLWPFIRKAVLE
jgi:hypothetical protein